MASRSRDNNKLQHCTLLWGPLLNSPKLLENFYLRDTILNELLEGRKILLYTELKSLKSWNVYDKI